ncbi:MAG: RNA polymerase sigma factor [Candidatus Hydrogenedentes bacterium]|nr:RNA polymerase sigma factor [Candidatus Hydrogenedentota bacterium]
MLPNRPKSEPPAPPEPASVDCGDPAVLTEDALWVKQAQCGDARAFERLYRRHLGRTYALCLRMMADRHQAEEAVQEVFIRTWEKLPTFRGESSFSTWLHRLTVNHTLMILRKRQRGQRLFAAVEDAAPEEQTPPPVHPQHKLDLEWAIAQLPTGARAVFLLHEIEGYQHDEIAALLDIAPGTCKAQLHRARRLLREWLSQ